MTIIYNGDHKVFQYCDGTNWRAMLAGRALDPDLATLTDVDDAILPGGGDCLVYSSFSGQWDAQSCAGAAGGDDLGDHAADQNLILGTHWLSGDGGDEGIYIDTDGNVGIGTAGSLYPLDVRNTTGDSQLHLSGSAADSGMYLATAAASAAFVAGGASYDGTGWIAKDPSVGVFGFFSGNFTVFNATGQTVGTNVVLTPRLRIASDGNVGIGETNPQALLHVDGTVRFEDFLTCTALETNASGDLVCGSDGGITAESDPQVGTLTNGKWCTTNGSAVNCTSDTPAAVFPGTLCGFAATSTSGICSSAGYTSYFTCNGTNISTGTCPSGYTIATFKTGENSAGNLDYCIRTCGKN